MRFQVRRDGVVVFESDSPADQPPTAWTEPSANPIGVHSLWFTLVSDTGKIHDIAATGLVVST